MQIQIKGYGFQLSEPFQPGTVITKAEAQALNDLRAENIQNNLRKMVALACEGLAPGQLLAQDVLAGIQTKLTEYDRSYQFVEKRTRSRVSDIEAETRQVARERVEAGLRRTASSATPAQLEELVLRTMELPGVIEEARDRVAARRRALSGSLADL